MGIKEIPYERIEFKDENEELERLLLENFYREKTFVQKMKEAELWEDIVRIKAEERRLANLKQNTEGDIGLPRKNTKNEQGKTSDIVAEKIGTSGKTYARAKSAFKEIKRLESEGKEQDAKFLITILNENVRGAKDIAKSNKISHTLIQTNIPQLISILLVILHLVKKLKN
ncbi:hypothetical protein [Clostridium kluyveri]|uniref:Uncharacterized protein n=1 Tax=Clostridium kluyveri (strain ATCC 8527 / DSM 555 / NBRC 12016 / NCIMB 10680 / K1) TaxID=431943 RepID=A5N5E7_CLOK5|nr:hypothetical protein [Clostridium kluyveri]EDK32528.1 Hypothetical protein CKL_0474 [Clostridium kluyveri DSM 555]